MGLFSKRENTDSSEIVSIKTKMIELLEQDRKREYLDLIGQNYAEAVETAIELFTDCREGDSNESPEARLEATVSRNDLCATYYFKSVEMKKRGDVEGEIRILETAIQGGVYLPVCYERLAILYSKQKNHKQAHEVCQKWFDSDFWKFPQTATSSLRLLDRLEKLERRLLAEGTR